MHATAKSHTKHIATPTESAEYETGVSNLLHILLQGPGQGHVHNPPHPLGIHPHPKGNSSHYHLDFANTEGLLDMLPILLAYQSISNLLLTSSVRFIYTSSTHSPIHSFIHQLFIGFCMR